MRGCRLSNEGIQAQYPGEIGFNELKQCSLWCFMNLFHKMLVDSPFIELNHLIFTTGAHRRALMY